jgi:K+-transporting ATPase ATPase C chain
MIDGNKFFRYTKGNIMFKELRPAVVSFLLLTLLTGIAYPLLVTGISQGLMPGQANGSLIVKDGKPTGSELIGQSFSDPKYFWSRPSATGPMPNNATASSGSNLGPTNPALMDGIKARVQALRDADPGNQKPVPVDLVTASASGLDPHISPAAVEYQLARVARVRNISPDVLHKLVAEHTEGRQFGFLGEPRVNVLKLNLALDAAH